MDDLNARIAEIEAELKRSTRYPDKIAIDAIRSISTFGGSMSREDAVDVIRNFAQHAKVDEELVTARLADLQVRRMALDQVLDAASLKVDHLVGDIIHLDATEFAAPNTTAKEG